MLGERLQAVGYAFRLRTDTETICHLIAFPLDEPIRLGCDAADRKTVLAAVQLALKCLKGTFGLGILFRDHPDLLVAARLGSPLVIGVGKDEYFLASDASPLVGYTEQVVYLSDHELALLSPQGIELVHRDNGRTAPSITVLDQTSGDSELGEFEHYMLKEIFEQPTTIENALRGRLDDAAATAVLSGLKLTLQ